MRRIIRTISLFCISGLIVSNIVFAEELKSENQTAETAEEFVSETSITEIAELEEKEIDALLDLDEKEENQEEVVDTLEETRDVIQDNYHEESEQLLDGESNLSEESESAQKELLNGENVAKDEIAEPQVKEPVVSLGALEEYSEEETKVDENDAVASDDISDISFNTMDLISGNNFTFNGNNGRPAVILFGGLSSCYNTMSAIDSLNMIVDRTDSSRYDIYLFDIKSNSANDIKEEANDYNWHSGLRVARYNNTDRVMRSLYSKCVTNYTLDGSYTMPLIVYKGANGKLLAGTTGSVSETNIIGNLNRIGINVSEATTNDTYETFTVKYDQQEARSMFPMIRSFRASSDAWYWDITNTNRVSSVSANGGNLLYDKNLEAIAMLRAAELAKNYSHTRPNGKRCFSAYNLVDYGYMASGENIAYGYRSAADVFAAWREDDKSYEGQGHRRNMLGTQFYAVGIGHCIYNGVHYWVQEFASPNYYSSSDSPYINSAVLNDYANVKVFTSGVGQFSIERATTGVTSETTPEATTPATTPVQEGWKQDSTGWWYQNSDGTCP